FNKIGHPLGGCRLPASPRGKGQSLQCFLVFQPLQGTKMFILWYIYIHIDLYHNTRIGKWVVALGGRHPIDHYFSLCRGRGHYETASAHTKGIDPPVPNLFHQTIGSGRKQFIAFPRAMVLNTIDDMLWMLYPYAHGKGFGL